MVFKAWEPKVDDTHVLSVELTMGSVASRPSASVYPTPPVSICEKELIGSLSSFSLSPPTLPKSSDGTLSLSNLAAWETTAAADPKIQLARTILSHTNIRSALTSREAYIADRHVFNTEVEFKTGPVTNQKSSGRCWLFATTNVLRYDVMKKLKLKEFQLSQVRHRCCINGLRVENRAGKPTPGTVTSAFYFLPFKIICVEVVPIRCEGSPNPIVSPTHLGK